jgi:carotenoid cleavage dioxygenase-like enzyme
VADEKPFHLKGNFAPVSEEVTATDLRVEGAIPPELSGLFVRNGANPVTGHSAHWFLGNGMVHGVRLERGGASWYRNRYVQTPFLEDPERPRISPEGVPDRTVSAANTHVIGHAGEILALEEGSFPFVLTGELETVGAKDYDGRLQTAMTAHPKICPVTGELLFFGYGQLPPYLVYHRASPDGKLVQSEEITVGGPTMIHDFAITERHAVFMDLPVVFDLQLAIQGTMPFHWSDDYPARVGIMPRHGGDADVRWFEVDPCYVFHGLNAYDAGDSVVFDVCRISEIWRNAGEMASGQGVQSLHRWTFDLSSGSTKEETLDERGMDFPRVADARVGQPHRFGFTLQFSGPEGGPGFAGLLKFDFESGSSVLHDFGPGRSPGEPVFVPAAGSDPNGDEGWVMTYLHDEAAGRSEFVILDATSFEAEPVARIPLPQRVPYGFHGSWISDAR